jgi:AcrR family transcriptional regulator
VPKVSEAYLENRRNQILEAAWVCFGRSGYHDTTMQDICKESGLSYGALYRYFDSKEAILRATSERAQTEIINRMTDMQAQASPHEALHSLGAEIFLSVNDPECDAATKVNLETLPEVLRRPDLVEAMRAEPRLWIAGLSSAFHEAQVSGHLSGVIDAEALSVLLVCAYEGLRIHHLVDPDQFRPELVLSAIDALMSGLSLDGDKAASA